MGLTARQLKKSTEELEARLFERGWDKDAGGLFYWLGNPAVGGKSAEVQKVENYEWWRGSSKLTQNNGRQQFKSAKKKRNWR